MRATSKQYFWALYSTRVAGRQSRPIIWIQSRISGVENASEHLATSFHALLRHLLGDSGQLAAQVESIRLGPSLPGQAEQISRIVGLRPSQCPSYCLLHIRHEVASGWVLERPRVATAA